MTNSKKARRIAVVTDILITMSFWSIDSLGSALWSLTGSCLLIVEPPCIGLLNAASACKALWYSAYSSKLRSTPSFLNSIFVSPSLGIVLFAVAAASKLSCNTMFVLLVYKSIYFISFLYILICIFYIY